MNKEGYQDMDLRLKGRTAAITGGSKGMQHRLDSLDRAELVESLGAHTQLGRRLRAAQQQHGHHRSSVIAEA